MNILTTSNSIIIFCITISIILFIQFIAKKFFKSDVQLLREENEDLKCSIIELKESIEDLKESIEKSTETIKEKKFFK